HPRPPPHSSPVFLPCPPPPPLSTLFPYTTLFRSRVLVLTSTAPGEGKTLTSVNLALTLATMDGQVLLLDADLRKPQAHELLGQVDRKSTRLNSSHGSISYAVFCLKKKKKHKKSDD